MLKFIKNLFNGRKQQCNLPVVSGSKLNRIAQMQKHFENGDIKMPEHTPLFEPPKVIIGCDLAVEGTDYTVTYYR